MTKHATSVVAQLRVVGADAGLDLLPRDRRRNRVDVHLRSEFRCVALDHIGFGLSSRSARREDHRPESHARRLVALLDHLDLRGITLFMNDWGGPIGLDFARRHPERVKRLVIANNLVRVQSRCGETATRKSSAESSRCCSRKS